MVLTYSVVWQADWETRTLSTRRHPSSTHLRLARFSLSRSSRESRLPAAAPPTSSARCRSSASSRFNSERLSASPMIRVYPCVFQRSPSVTAAQVIQWDVASAAVQEWLLTAARVIHWSLCLLSPVRRLSGQQCRRRSRQGLLDAGIPARDSYITPAVPRVIFQSPPPRPICYVCTGTARVKKQYPHGIGSLWRCRRIRRAGVAVPAETCNRCGFM